MIALIPVMRIASRPIHPASVEDKLRTTVHPLSEVFYRPSNTRAEYNVS